VDIRLGRLYYNINLTRLDSSVLSEQHHNLI